MPDPRFLQASPTAFGGVPGTRGPAGLPENTTLDEERREVVAGVLGALAGNSSDPDQMAACGYLLKHLSQTAGHLAPPAA